MNNMKAFKTGLLAIAVCTILTKPVLANDGWISFGGTPHLMHADSTITMSKERIKIDVTRKLVTVECNFEFKNNGHKCTVRMGFPDENGGAYQGEKGTFLSYDSFVDGTKVQTSTVKGDKYGQVWHEKSVDFEEGQVRHIRDIYTVVPGMRVASPRGGMRQIAYILDTASSWSGAVGQADLEIVFHDLPGPLRAIARKDLPGDHDPQEFNWARANRNTVIYSGPSAAKVIGNCLYFSAINLKPSIDDDVILHYDYQDARVLEREEERERREKSNKSKTHEGK